MLTETVGVEIIHEVYKMLVFTLVQYVNKRKFRVEY